MNARFRKFGDRFLAGREHQARAYAPRSRTGNIGHIYIGCVARLTRANCQTLSLSTLPYIVIMVIIRAAAAAAIMIIIIGFVIPA